MLPTEYLQVLRPWRLAEGHSPMQCPRALVMPDSALPSAGSKNGRLPTIDALRGIVMVLMALDHVRDFFSNGPSDPTDLAVTTPGYFFTRWITHFCAPVFVFLAGTGACLHGHRSGRSRGDLSIFLLTRGIWMVVLEFTLVRWGWTFNFGYSVIIGQVIWAIGCSMIVLAALVFLPARWIGIFGAILILGHNAFDDLRFSEGDWKNVVWTVLHRFEPVPLSSGRVFIPIYPILPWIGVMAAGFGFGKIYQWPEEARTKTLVRMGLAMVLGFGLLRFTNLYGDPSPWARQPSAALTFISFLNCTKYPPSLLYLLMTLGPAILLLAVMEKGSARIPQWIVVFGRVPLFYYLLHVYLIHFLAGVFASIRARPREVETIWHNEPFGQMPAGYGYDLWVVYVVWVGVILALYPLCRWFADLKRRSRNPWLSYL